MLRIETALSNTAARLWDAIEETLNPLDRRKDKVAEQVDAAATTVQDLQRHAVATWQQGRFQELSPGERLKLGTDWIRVAKNAISQAESEIRHLPPQLVTDRFKALKVISEQQARLDGILEEHREQLGHSAIARSRAQAFEARAAGQPPLGSTHGPIQAQVQSGNYCGTITEVSNSVIVQRISPWMSVEHKRERLSAVPQIGEKTVIRYSNGLAAVHPVRGHSRGNELER